MFLMRVTSVLLAKVSDISNKRLLTHNKHKTMAKVFVTKASEAKLAVTHFTTMFIKNL